MTGSSESGIGENQRQGLGGRPPFEIQETRRHGWVRLSITGELDMSTALTFRRRLRALKASNTSVYVDLSQLEFIDCAGAHALEDAISDSREGSWRLEVEPNMPPQAKRVFDVIGSVQLQGGVKRPNHS